MLGAQTLLSGCTFGRQSGVTVHLSRLKLTTLDKAVNHESRIDDSRTDTDYSQRQITHQKPARFKLYAASELYAIYLI